MNENLHKMLHIDHTKDNSVILYTGFPRLLGNLEKPGIYFGSLNPGNSLEFYVKTLNPLEICERQKNRSTHISFFFLNFIMFYHQPFFRKIIETSLECCIDQKNLEINGRSH